MRSLHLAPALLYIVGLHSSAQEPVPLDRAREFARALNESVGQLTGSPVHVDADVLNPFGIRHGEAGALVVPDRNLTAAALNAAGDTALPVGELFLRNVVLTTEGSPVASSKLQQVTVGTQEQKVQVPMYLLAAKKNAEGKLDLLVFGKGAEPVAKTTLGKVTNATKFPIELTAEKQDDKTGLLTLKIAGQFEAELLLQKAETP